MPCKGAQRSQRLTSRDAVDNEPLAALEASHGCPGLRPENAVDGTPVNTPLAQRDL